MSIMSKTTACYLAGFTDGEGYIGIMCEDKHGHISYLPVIKIASTNEEIIDWLKDSFGGWKHTRRFHDNSKDAHSWTLAGRKMKPFIEKILPYLKIKRKQAEIVLKRIKLYDKAGYGEGSGNNFRYPPIVLKQIEDFYRDIRILNQRGLVQSERLN